MSNPLLSMMNPLSNLASMSPMQMAMNMLKNTNPSGYQQFQSLVNSGKNPNVILNELMSQLTPQQKAQLQQMASQFGIK